MNASQAPRFTHLFEQLGLDSDEAGIRRFLDGHRPLADDLEIYEAPFWTPQQADMLREKLKGDDDWAIVVDQLSAALREPIDPQELPQAGDPPACAN